MTQFFARMMDGRTGGEGRYTFEASDDVMRRPADEIVDLFFGHVSAQILHESINWELNSVMKKQNGDIVTALGSFLHHEDPPVPFLVMISDRE